MNQTATVSHQVKCQSTKAIKVRLSLSLFSAIMNFIVVSSNSVSASAWWHFKTSVRVWWYAHWRTTLWRCFGDRHVRILVITCWSYGFYVKLFNFCLESIKVIWLVVFEWKSSAYLTSSVNVLDEEITHWRSGEISFISRRAPYYYYIACTDWQEMLGSLKTERWLFCVGGENTLKHLCSEFVFDCASVA